VTAKKHKVTREELMVVLAAGQLDTGTRLQAVEGHYEILNRELGEVVGELRTIKWLVGGTMLAASAGLVKLLLGV